MIKYLTHNTTKIVNILFMQMIWVVNVFLKVNNADKIKRDFCLTAIIWMSNYNSNMTFQWHGFQNKWCLIGSSSEWEERNAKSYSRAGDIGEKNRSEVTPGDHYHRDAQHLLMLFWLLLFFYFVVVIVIICIWHSIKYREESPLRLRGHYSLRSHYFV